MGGDDKDQKSNVISLNEWRRSHNKRVARQAMEPKDRINDIEGALNMLAERLNDLEVQAAQTKATLNKILGHLQNQQKR